MRSLRRGGFFIHFEANRSLCDHGSMTSFSCFALWRVSYNCRASGGRSFVDIPIYRNTTCCDYGDADCSLI